METQQQNERPEPSTEEVESCNQDEQDEKSLTPEQQAQLALSQAWASGPIVF